jgi:putative endopeptidase
MELHFMKLNIGFLTLSLMVGSSAFALPSLEQSKQADDPLHLEWLNTSVSPGQDFYAYANGTWQKNNPIPPEYASWGSFNILNERIQNLVHDMLIKASQNTKAKPGSLEQKIGDFYYSGMDESLINKLGVTPLNSEFASIANIKDLSGLQKEIAHLHQIGVDVLFGFGSMQDFKDSSLMIAAVMQGGLGLPDRDYYLKKDLKFQQIREAYVAHISRMFILLGDDPDRAAQEAKTIMDIETQLATASMSQIEQRDPHAIYHMKPVTVVEKKTPNFNWSKYFRALGQNEIEMVNFAMPHFFEVMNRLLVERSLSDWKTYLRWHLLDDYASYLSQPFVDEQFKMAQALSGVEKILPRWKRVVNTESGALGFAIGKMYVDKYFSAQSKIEVIGILNNIRAVLKEDIAHLKWMTPSTRSAALKKLDLMQERIGYPEKWRDYSTLQIDRGPYVLNVIKANQFLVKRDLNKIGKPIDRTEWAMTPQTINAYYDPSMNNLNMPAGILQSPFFDPKAPAAVNYGAVGFIMGHEMTHGFDDQGAQFDGNGNLKNWWSPSDLSQFNKATQCISDQFSKYTVDGDMHVQGKLVVGEAAADLGGINLAYKAFHRSNAYKNAKVIDGLTPDQQFFLGVAHIWAINMRPQQMRNQVTTDPHPPAQYRVNGSLANMPQFKQAFDITGNSPMVNLNPCTIW